MGNTYARVQEDEEGESRLERARIILEMMTDKTDKIYSECMAFRLQPADQVQ
jgi:hypothetical protein